MIPDVLSPGSNVLIGDDIQAHIVGVWLRAEGYVAYECAWWDGRSRCTEWLPATEVRKRPLSNPSVGFSTEKRMIP